MCGRYAVVDPDAIRELREIRITPQLGPMYNIAITDAAPIVCCDAPDEVKLARWSITPQRSRALADFKASTFNATSESPMKPTFAPLVARQRCIVPASGMFEWPVVGGKKRATYIRPVDAAMWALAGLWCDWANPTTGEVTRGFTILTVSPNDFMRPIHHRMPVILPRAAVTEWLDPKPRTRDDLEDLLVPYSGLMTAHRVTSRVGNVRYRAPDCVTPIPGVEPEVGETLSLFG